MRTRRRGRGAGAPRLQPPSAGRGSLLAAPRAPRAQAACRPPYAPGRGSWEAWACSAGPGATRTPMVGVCFFLKRGRGLEKKATVGRRWGAGERSLSSRSPGPSLPALPNSAPGSDARARPPAPHPALVHTQHPLPRPRPAPPRLPAPRRPGGRPRARAHLPALLLQNCPVPGGRGRGHARRLLRQRRSPQRAPVREEAVRRREGGGSRIERDQTCRPRLRGKPRRVGSRRRHRRAPCAKPPSPLVVVARLEARL